MKISKKGLELIKKFEGFETKAYLCQAGVWTIGYGHTKGVKEGMVITQEQADSYLMEDTTSAQDAVNRISGLNQNQFDALVSLAFNIGNSAFLNSTAFRLAKMNPNDPDIGRAIRMWNKIRVSGELVVSSGLSRRRKEESDLYFS